MRLRVVTYNIHSGRPRTGPEDLAATADALNRLAPDVAGLQEVNRWAPRRGAFADQPAWIAGVCGMRSLFAPSVGALGIGYGNALLARHPIRKIRRIALPSRREPRTALAAEADLGAGRIGIITTHLSLDAAERRGQCAALVGLLTGIGGPLLLMGDLNCQPDTDEFQMLLASGLRSAAATPVPTCPSDAPTQAIDHILVSADFRVERCWAAPECASDHLPLLAELYLEQSAVGSNHAVLIP